MEYYSTARMDEASIRRWTAPSSPICGAIEYALKRWDKLTIYATTHLLDIDSNKVEHLIRPVTIGRKNLMFAGSHDAAQRSAMLYSLPGTARRMASIRSSG